MAENIIFERSVGTGRREGDVTIKLVADGPNEIERCQPQEINIIESFGSMSPIVSITLTDKNGDLFNHMKLSTDIVFTLSLLRSLDIAVDMRLKVAKYRLLNGTVGRPTDITFQIQFVVENWLEISGKERCRGWYDKKLSDIIKEIGAECKYEEVLVSDTDENVGSVVQPYWDNAVFTKWAKTEAVSKKSNSHFEYGVTTDNRFIFKSIDDVLEENKSKISGNQLPVLKLQSHLDSATASKEEQQNNQEIPAYFYGFDVIEDYMAGIVNGSGGIKTIYYDYDNDELVKKDNDLTGIKFKQMSDYCLVSSTDNKNHIRHFHGRGTVEKENQDKTYLSDLNLSVLTMAVVIDGNPLVHIFDMYEVIIPNSVNASKEVVSQIYSGFYMVASVKHTIALNKTAKYNTTIGLIRHGVDDNGYDGLDKLQISGGGKI